MGGKRGEGGRRGGMWEGGKNFGAKKRLKKP